MLKTALVFVSTLTAFGCTHSTKVSAPVPEEGKPMAPVAMEAELRDGAARLTLQFETEASAVQVNVSGLDGLVVSGAPTLVSEGSFAKGERKVFDVAFTPGPGRSHLAVAVSGMFKGAKMDRVATFAVGTPTDEQLKGPGTRMTTSDGQGVKVMPSKTE